MIQNILYKTRNKQKTKTKQTKAKQNKKQKPIKNIVTFSCLFSADLTYSTSDIWIKMNIPSVSSIIYK